MQETSEHRISYGVGEAARVCGLGRTFLYEKIGAGELKSIKIGSRRLILHADLMSFLTNRDRS